MSPLLFRRLIPAALVLLPLLAPASTTDRPIPPAVPAGRNTAGPADRDTAGWDTADRGTTGCRRPWVVPVEARVIDPFRPPDGPYGPGNRGIEYATTPGQAVVAVDDGVVTFAGPVAGAPVVVIDHGGGLRSSSVHLQDASVAAGQAVTGGEAIGTADRGFHLGARLGSTYLDPAELVERRCVVIRSVPV